MVVNNSKTKKNNLQKKFHLHHLVIIGILVFVGSLSRIILVGWNLQPFPNFEVIMILTFICALYLKPQYVLIIPLVSMILSDIVLGNSILFGNQMNQIVFFTYSGFFFIGGISIIAKGRIRKIVTAINIKSIGVISGMSICLTLLYDIWTNFGWWYLMYPHTLSTFIAVYIAGIPFMIYHLLSTSFTFLVIALPFIVSYPIFSAHPHPILHSIASKIH
jgi:hypothetical protein